MYKLPYLEAVQLLPGSMVLHLTKHNKQALSPHVRKKLVLANAMLIMS
jgi:RNA polymerase I-specific transcription initiation factor RRN7